MNQYELLDESLSFLNEETLIFRSKEQMEDKIERLKNEYDNFEIISKDKVEGISGEECWKLTYKA